MSRKKQRRMWVHSDFAEGVKQKSREYSTSMLDVTKDMARDLDYLYNDKKKKK